MKRLQIPVSTLPAWAKLNDVRFLDIVVRDLGEKGYGIVAERDLSSDKNPTLLSIPNELIISAATIEAQAKADKDLQQVLQLAGGKSLRGDALLFLLFTSSATRPNSWTDYVKMLSSDVPVPTTWGEDQQQLIGTSLEAALSAKMIALEREFDALRAATADIPWCKEQWWENESLTFDDWVMLDAWFRSRSLELPLSGDSMVPCLDMVNHSASANAYFEQTEDGVSLLLRPNQTLAAGDEITISYGDAKTPAEMLFSYGFIDEAKPSQQVVLALHPQAQDPLAKAKALAFNGPPVVRIFVTDDAVQWESPFVYFVCLNEEDGLDFKILQQVDGGTALCAFWQDEDVTSRTKEFETLINKHPLRDVFRLRAVALLEQRIQEQLERMQMAEHMTNKTVVRLLRESEEILLDAAATTLEIQRTTLMESETVKNYLNAVQTAPPPNEGPPSAEADFS